jgi:subtilisin family serine protease
MHHHTRFLLLSSHNSVPIVTIILVISLSLNPLFASLVSGQGGASNLSPSAQADLKIDPQLSAQFSGGKTADFFVWLRGQADLSPAAAMENKSVRGAFVLNALQNEAAYSQTGVVADLNELKADFQTYYISNVVLVKAGSAQMARRLAERTDVARLSPNLSVAIDDPIGPASSPLSPQVFSGIGANLTFIKANQVWSQSINGSGVTVALMDTGLKWDHPAIKAHYRGWNGSSVDHNYNWWDAAGDAAGNQVQVPSDDTGHGTLVSGTIIGDDGAGTVTGVAPGAKLMACRAGENLFSYSSLLTCMQWALAPWDLNHSTPDPSKAPDIINNSWGTRHIYQGEMEPAFNALRSAGILIVNAAGNDGPDCLTMSAESNIPGILSVGALDYEGLPFPGRLAGFSSRGPSPRGAAYAPMVVAPGTSVITTSNDGQYHSTYGTSLAAPQVAGLAALILQANPALKGHPDDIAFLIRQSAAPLAGETGSNCGGDYTTGPNNDWGHGTIDALAAVAAAKSYSNHWGTLNGSVVFSGLASGAAKPLATVQLSSGDLVYTTLSDASGQYHLAVQAGHTYQVAAYAAGYVRGTGTFTPTDGGSVTRGDTLLPIQTRHTLSGKISERLPGYPVVALILLIANNPADNTFEYTVSSPVDGSYTLSLVDGVEYYVQPIYYISDPLADKPVMPTLVPAGAANRTLDLTIEPDSVFCQRQEFNRQGSGYDFYFLDYLPAGWENVDLSASGSGPVWNLTPPISNGEAPNIAGGIGNYALADSTASPGVDMHTALVTNSMDIPSLTSVGFQFNYTFHGGEAQVDYSTDQGATWQLLDRLYQGTEISWYERLGTRTLGKNSVRFRIQYQGHNSGSLALDDVWASLCQARTGGFIYGTVKDASTGAPVANARVTVTTNMTTKADTISFGPLSGMYRLFVPLPPGPSYTSLYPRVNNAWYYEAQTASAYVGSNYSSSKMDVSLNAAHYTVQPGTALQMNLPPGSSTQASLNIKNTGSIAGVVKAHLSIGAAEPATAESGWTSENNYPLALADASLTYLNGQYYAFGGQDASTVYPKAYRYDPQNPVWQPLPDLPVGRAYHTALALSGKIYLLGGWDAAHALLTRVDVYDPQANNWSSAAPLPNGYLGPGAAVVDGKLYVLGGANLHPDGLGGYYYTPVSDFYKYDPAKNEWTTLANLFSQAGFWNCLSKASIVMCAGGYASTSPGYAGSLVNYLFSYNLANDNSINLKNMLARHGQATSATTLGRLYMTGGVTSPAVGILSDSSIGEFYEPELDRWVQIPGIGDVHGAAGACGLMAIGGESSSGVFYNRTWHLAGEGFCDQEAIPWLSVDQASLTLNPGATGVLHLTLDSHNLVKGVYHAHLTVVTDAPDDHFDVPITLTVSDTGEKKIYLPAVSKR